MKFLNKLTELRKQKLTFMIVPHNGKNVKQLRINLAVTYSTIIITFITSIFFVGATYILYNQNSLLETDLQISNDEIRNLNIIDNQQKIEIDSLKSTSKFVIDKLSELYTLEDQVRNLVGLETSDTQQTFPITSRYLDSRFEDLESNIDFLSIEGFKDDESINAISGLIEDEMGKYDQLIKDVEKQLKFLDSKPNHWPTIGKITSSFGYRRHPISGKKDFHKGIDLANKTRTSITAAGSGIVTFSGWNGGYGRVIIISHGYGYKSVYAHNNKNLVEVGQKVNKGDIIAELGNTGRSTGPHLHFEIHFNGNEIDPLKILKSE